MKDDANTSRMRKQSQSSDFSGSSPETRTPIGDGDELVIGIAGHGVNDETMDLIQQSDEQQASIQALGETVLSNEHEMNEIREMLTSLELPESLETLSESITGNESEEAAAVDLLGSEFSSLNNVMEELQKALDRIEARNAQVHEEFLELLRSNREIRNDLMKNRSVEVEPSEGQESEARSSSSAE